MGSDAGGSPWVGDERVPSAHPRALSGALRDHSGELRHACCRKRTRRHPQTVMEWLHLYNTRGPEALVYQRTGGCPPFARRSGPVLARRSVPPNDQPPLRRSRCRSAAALAPCGVWSAGCASGLAGPAAARRRAPPFIVWDCRGRRPRSCSAGPIRSAGRPLSSRSGLCRPVPSTTAISWPTWTKPTSTRIPIPSTAGRSAASASGSPRTRRVCRTGSRSTASISTTKAQVRLWPYARANGEHTVDVLRRLRAEWPEDKLIVVWDGASYHRAGMVREAAEGVTHRPRAVARLQPRLHAGRGSLALAPGGCHRSLLPSHRRKDLSRPAAAFETRLNQDAYAVADRLWVVLKYCLDPDEEKLRFSKVDAV